MAIQVGLSMMTLGSTPLYATTCLRHPARDARGANPSTRVVEVQQLVVAALAAAQSQEAMGQNAALKEGVELVFDEAWRLGTGTGVGVGDETGRVLQHQAV